MEDTNTFIYELKLFEMELIKLKQKVENLVVDSPQVFDELRTKLNNIVEQVTAYRMTLEVVSGSENDELVFWYEIGANGKESSVELGFTPLDISKCLYEKIFQDLHSTILTSATLQIAGSFDYLLFRTGMIYLGDEKVIKAAVGSPFKYREQSAFYTYHAEQFKKNTMESVASLIIRLAEEISRGMMVLFTSYSSLKETYRAVNPYLKKIGTTLLAQGYGASRTNLLNQFRKEKKSVLFGTDSFWEGIDIIGDALEVLIINKLPFPVPSEPIIEANIEDISKKGKDPFLEYYVPEAVIKFRQGFGRLIRSSTDIGIVINLDNRIDKKKYGIVFKESLPVEPVSICGEEEMINVVNSFFSYNSINKK
jgi:Rad3-related DNA helicase